MQGLDAALYDEQTDKIFSYAFSILPWGISLQQAREILSEYEGQYLEIREVLDQEVRDFALCKGVLRRKGKGNFYVDSITGDILKVDWEIVNLKDWQLFKLSKKKNKDTPRTYHHIEILVPYNAG